MNFSFTQLPKDTDLTGQIETRIGKTTTVYSDVGHKDQLANIRHA